MKPTFRELRMVLSSVRLLPHIMILLACRNYGLVQADLRRWADILRQKKPTSTVDYLWLFVFFMTFTPEFRNLFHLRAGRWSRIVTWLCPRLASLDIAPTSIGPGLFIQHGESTYVSARRIGANCWIGRQVVIGYSGEDQYPTIGNNVRIFAGAKIVGNITIGDDVTIGLNTVITDHVPSGVTMLGVPGRVIWRNRPSPASAGEEAAGRAQGSHFSLVTSANCVRGAQSLV